MSNRDAPSESETTLELLADDAETSTQEQIPVPPYESEQYLPDAERISAARHAVLQEEFGTIRTFFKERPEHHWRLQRQLNQGRFGTTYDVYLTRSIVSASVAGIAGAILGVGLAVLLAQLGLLAGLESPVPLTGEFVRVVANNRFVFAGASLALLLTLTGAGAVWFGRYYYPYFVVDARRRNINITLPHAIVYMYALSFGGMDLVRVLERLADSEETYGDVADEFDTVVRDIELFGNDLFTALRNARNLTPSDNMEQFLDDLLSVLDSGGDVTTFLRDESEKYMEQAQREQENFLDTLELLSEVFIVGFVAAPLFLVVTLMLMSFLGENTVPLLVLLVYAVIPLGMGMFLVVISMLSEPYKQPSHELSTDSRNPTLEPASPALRSHPAFHLFRGIRLRKRLSTFLSEPFRTFRDQPWYTLVVSVPAAAGFVWTLATAADLGLQWSAFVTAPLEATFVYVAVPFLTVAVPLSAFHEYERRRKRQIAQRLPDALDILASSNQMGVSLVEGFGLVTRNVGGAFAEELRKTRNDMAWNYDIQAALRSLADRLQVPQLTRTCHILAEGARSTGDLHKVLGIAAEDTRHRFRLDRNRQQELNSYVAIVVIGFLVYLGVIVVLDASFLGPITEQASGSTELSGPVSLNRATVDVYNVLFFHSAILQAIGTGLITGKLTDNRSLSGLKYSVALVLVALGVFAVL